MPVLGPLHRVLIPLFLLWSSLLEPAAATAQPVQHKCAVLVIAHGSSAEWNAAVEEAVSRVNQTLPAAAGFLMGVGRRPDEAYTALLAAGATRVAIVPLLVSSISDHAEQIRFIGGLRADYPHAEHMHLTQLRGSAPVIAVTSAMDDHPLLAAILTDRARALSRDPARESLVLVAHGPNPDAEALRWIETLQRLGGQITKTLPFAAVDVRLLRDDAPKPVKERALAELRAAVSERSAGGRVLVVPVLMAPGRVANQIPRVLEGLEYAWSGETILPDSRVADWILAKANEALASSHVSGPPATPRYEEEVFVTATRTERPRRELPVLTTVVDAERIGAANAQDVTQAVRSELGVDIVPTLAGAGIQIQGIGERGVLVLVDGQEVIGKIGGAIDAANLLASGISRIEIVKGAASSLYGSDALAGVINVLTDEPRDRVSVALEQRIESLGGRTSFLSGGTRRDAGSLFATASRVSRDSYDLTPAEPSTTSSAFRKVGASVKVARQARRLEGRASLRVYDEQARDVTAARGVILDDLVDDKRWQAVGEVRLQEVANGALTGRVHLTRYSHLLDRVTRASGVSAPDLTRERLTEGEVQYDRPVGTRHLVTLGGQVESFAMESDRITGGRRSASAGVLLAQDEWFATDRLRVLAGVRFDRNSAFGEAWSPRVGLLYAATSKVRIRGSYAEGFKAPEFKDLYMAFSNRSAGYSIVGNPALRPEHSRSLNAGLEMDLFADWLRARASRYSAIGSRI